MSTLRLRRACSVADLRRAGSFALQERAASSRRVRVYVLPVERLLPLMLGEARVRNLPPDAEVVAACAVDLVQVGVRVYSPSFAPVPERDPIPVVVAVFHVDQAGSVA